MTPAHALTPPARYEKFWGSDSREPLRPTRNRDFYRRHSQDKTLSKNRPL